ncbi:chorismate transformation enzyme, FkbO/Hyg5 family [Noviherbaspirillum aridicola]|uniref:Pteridine-dependent deoxygenase like protein n=1 Tax=Noviherbaspirillum aridicola TaxID=2849687 RepID=A0ABQ4Q692_9BURK|nr:hypothetical protein [Noviherbaspirillum aridicola]GIZ52562.1 pteridine-dependent deoxygenase like protein [Noviherbaspirillum aridicola]
MIDVAPAPLKCAYLRLDRATPLASASQSELLGAMCFGAAPVTAALPAGAPLVRVPMPALAAAGAEDCASEIWCGKGEVRYGTRGPLAFGYNRDLLFGAVQLHETSFDTAAAARAGKTPLQLASEAAYTAVFSLLDELAFPHVLRFWNYIADINAESHGMERYRQFNMGRQDGFLASGRAVRGEVVPAASAVGCDPGPLTVYFLAGRGQRPLAIENPRQVSAYDYPSQYGPRAPTFSRASVARLGEADVLFLSGTASIVGHQSLHVGDVAAQVRETLANIDAMVREANRAAPQAGFTMEALCYKVYVRRASDVPVIARELRAALPASTRILYLRADICRQDLLVEIEATAGHPMQFMADE